MKDKFFIGLFYFGIFATIALAVLDVYYSIYKYNNGIITKSALVSNIFINLLCYILIIVALIWMIIVRRKRK